MLSSLLITIFSSLTAASVLFIIFLPFFSVRYSIIVSLVFSIPCTIWFVLKTIWDEGGIKEKYESLTDNERTFVNVCFGVFAFEFIYWLLYSRNDPLNTNILFCSEMLFDCFVIMAVYAVYRLIRKRVIKSKVFYGFVCLFFLLSIPYIPKFCGYKTTQIGDFYEARQYTEKYYVLMSTKPKSNSKRKVYRLPATIERSIDDIGTTEEGRPESETRYHLKYLYLSNGGKLTFEYNEDAILIPDEEVKVYDKNGTEYYITLTKEKSKK